MVISKNKARRSRRLTLGSTPLLQISALSPTAIKTLMLLLVAILVVSAPLRAYAEDSAVTLESPVASSLDLHVPSLDPTLVHYLPEGTQIFYKNKVLMTYSMEEFNTLLRLDFQLYKLKWSKEYRSNLISLQNKRYSKLKVLLGTKAELAQTRMQKIQALNQIIKAQDKKARKEKRARTSLIAVAAAIAVVAVIGYTIHG